MAQKPFVIDQRQRELRQRSYQAAPSVAELFPDLEELAVELRFADPDGRVRPSPFKRIFVPDMQAFFEFQCPLRECSGGGFDLSRQIPQALEQGKTGDAAAIQCQGRRERASKEDRHCGLELRFELAVAEKQRG